MTGSIHGRNLPVIALLIVLVFHLADLEELTYAAPCAHAVAVKDIARLDASEVPQEHLYTGDYVRALPNLIENL